MAMGTRKKWGRRRKRVPLDASRGVVGSGGWEIVVRLMVAPLLGVGVAATAAGVGEKRNRNGGGCLSTTAATMEEEGEVVDREREVWWR